MPSSYHDFEDAYIEGVHRFVSLIKNAGAKEFILDLKNYFPETYEELVKAIDNEAKHKQLARLLDAGEVRCSRIRVEGVIVAGERSNSDKGD